MKTGNAEIQKHIDFLLKGNQIVVQKAMEYFDTEYLPKFGTTSVDMPLWRCAFTTALFRDVPTGDQKIYLLDRLVHNWPVVVVKPIVCRYLQRCAPGQHSKVMTVLEDIPALYTDAAILALLPFVPKPLCVF